MINSEIIRIFGFSDETELHDYLVPTLLRRKLKKEYQQAIGHTVFKKLFYQN